MQNSKVAVHPINDDDDFNDSQLVLKSHSTFQFGIPSIAPSVVSKTVSEHSQIKEDELNNEHSNLEKLLLLPERHKIEPVSLQEPHILISNPPSAQIPEVIEKKSDFSASIQLRQSQNTPDSQQQVTTADPIEEQFVEIQNLEEFKAENAILHQLELAPTSESQQQATITDPIGQQIVEIQNLEEFKADSTILHQLELASTAEQLTILLDEIQNDPTQMPAEQFQFCQSMEKSPDIFSKLVESVESDAAFQSTLIEDKLTLEQPCDYPCAAECETSYDGSTLSAGVKNGINPPTLSLDYDTQQVCYIT